MSQKNGLRYRMHLAALRSSLIAFSSAVLFSSAAMAAITCEQLAEIAAATQKLRDQGYSLQTVLGETGKLESSNKFSESELNTIKTTVDQAYKGGSRVPYDVLSICKETERR
jgi:hypothetical protein